MEDEKGKGLAADGAPPVEGSIVVREGTVVNVHLHPLVIINVSDHWTRVKVTNGDSNPRVIGALFGEQTGRTVEIMNSFELVVTEVDGQLVIDRDYLLTKQAQFLENFKSLELLGWYSTSESCVPADLHLHKQFMEYNESPFYLVLNAGLVGSTKDLPIYLYDTELRMINDTPTTLFAEVSYRIETTESERVAVDHIAHVGASDSGDKSQLAQHLAGSHGAIKMLHIRLNVVLRYLNGVKSGETPLDHSLLRKIGSLCNMLPAIDSKEFRKEFITEYNDALLVTYLASITKGSAQIAELLDHYNTAYDKHGRRGQRGGFQFM